MTMRESLSKRLARLEEAASARMARGRDRLPPIDHAATRRAFDAWRANWEAAGKPILGVERTGPAFRDGVFDDEAFINLLTRVLQ